MSRESYRPGLWGASTAPQLPPSHRHAPSTGRKWSWACLPPPQQLPLPGRGRNSRCPCPFPPMHPAPPAWSHSCPSPWAKAKGTGARVAPRGAPRGAGLAAAPVYPGRLFGLDRALENTHTESWCFSMVQAQGCRAMGGVSSLYLGNATPSPAWAPSDLGSRPPLRDPQGWAPGPWLWLRGSAGTGLRAFRPPQACPPRGTDRQ